jgi:hypothetical protein
MVTLVNSLESGSNTTALTGGAGGNTAGGGNYLDDVSTPNGTVTFSSTHAAHGSLAAYITSTATGNQPYIAWTTGLGGAQTKVWFRAYVYLAALPSGPSRLLHYDTAIGGNLCGAVFVNADGTLAMTGTNDAVQTILTTTAVTAGAWFRVEGFLAAGVGTGQISLSLYTVMDSDTAAETATSPANMSTQASIGAAVFGNFWCAVQFPGGWYDDIGVSTAGPLGPVIATAESGPNYAGAAAVLA